MNLVELKAFRFLNPLFAKTNNIVNWIKNVPNNTREITNSITVVALDEDDLEFEIPTNRGMFYKCEITVDQVVAADLIGNITLVIDGAEILKKSKLIKYSTFYQDRDTYIQVAGSGGSTVELNVDNTGPNPITVNVIFHYTNRFGLDVEC